jgi:hypothetical protein
MGRSCTRAFSEQESSQKPVEDGRIFSWGLLPRTSAKTSKDGQILYRSPLDLVPESSFTQNFHRNWQKIYGSCTRVFSYLEPPQTPVTMDRSSREVFSYLDLPQKQ